MLGTDVHDGEEILSDKHWVIAEVMKLESGQKSATCCLVKVDPNRGAAATRATESRAQH